MLDSDDLTGFLAGAALRAHLTRTCTYRVDAIVSCMHTNALTPRWDGAMLPAGGRRAVHCGAGGRALCSPQACAPSTQLFTLRSPTTMLAPTLVSMCDGNIAGI